MGEIVDGVDMRAEVGVLTRNIVIKGEMEDSCYTGKDCRFFNYDTFGGHIKVWKEKFNFTISRLQWLLFLQIGHSGGNSILFHII